MLAHLTDVINALKGLLESAERHRVGASFVIATGLLSLAAILLVR